MWTFFGKVLSLLFNMLSRFVITFLPRSKCLLYHHWDHHLQWFWNPKNKICPCFPICHEVMGLDTPLQYSCLQNPMDGGAWWSAVYGVAHDWRDLAAAVAYPLGKMWELDCKEGWALKNWSFQTVMLKKTLEIPLECKRSKQSILKEISPEYSLEGLTLKLKLQYLGHLMWRTDSFWKEPDAGKDWRWEKVTTEDEMSGWHHRLDGHEFE